MQIAVDFLVVCGRGRSCRRRGEGEPSYHLSYIKRILESILGARFSSSSMSRAQIAKKIGLPGADGK